MRCYDSITACAPGKRLIPTFSSSKLLVKHEIPLNSVVALSFLLKCVDFWYLQILSKQATESFKRRYGTAIILLLEMT